MDFAALLGLHLQAVLTFNGLAAPYPSLYITNTYKEANHTWVVYNHKHWQVVSDKFEPAVVDSVCGPNMVHVQGWMKRDLIANNYAKTVEALQKTACLKWIERKEPLDKCAIYDRDKWLEISKNLPKQHMDFCIDKFEAFSLVGQNPIIMVDFNEAEALCETQGKRICTEDEWTFACEGEEATPYAYGGGYRRDDKICNIDKKWRPYHESAFAHRDSPQLAAELDSLWQGEPSGVNSECKSVFGVYNQNGNVDEWTRSNHPGNKAILRGGYWAPIRSRCRASTRSHEENFTFYQQSFRCCK